MGERANGEGSWPAEWHHLLSHPTRLTIIRALREKPREITELADAADVHPNTVRSHLDRLHKAGVLEVESPRRGKRGRPTKQYRLLEPLDTPSTSSGETPRLLMRAVVSLSGRVQGQSAVDVATEEGFRLGRQLGPQSAGEDGEDGWLLDLLDQFSFAPRARRDGDGTEVDLLHCPFWGGPAEENGDVVCSFHLGMLRGAADSAGRDPETVTLLPFAEPGCCRVTITPTD